MGKVQIDFVGLFLFRSDLAGGKRVAVIHASRDGVSHGGKQLRPHRAFFTFSGTTTVDDWPRNDLGCVLTRNITIDGAAPAVVEVPNRWVLPKFGDGCEPFQPGTFFDAPEVNRTHAILSIPGDAGTGQDWCAWRVRSEPGPGAINTRLTFSTPDRFAITRDDGKRIVFDVAENVFIIFENTEETPTPDDGDWFWYYVATGMACTVGPKNPHVQPPCTPLLDPLPSLSLGCSNSDWP